MRELFKEGDVVYHIHNLDQKLIVDNIYVEKKLVVDKYNAKEEKFEKKEKKIMRGVGVHWWNATGSIETFRFHSRELIPESIRELGEKEIEKYLSKK